MKISSIGYLIKEGIKNTWTNRIMSLASVGVLISCLVLTGAASLLTLNVSQAVESVGASNVTTVYLDKSVSELEAIYIGKDIETVKNVTEIEFFSKDEAIKDYRDVLGDDVFAEMQGDKNPLPHAFKVTMEDLSKYDKTVADIKKIEGVDTVSSLSDVAGKLTPLNKLISIVSIAIIIALAIISLFIIANTIRMTMYSRRFEISIMKSVGATNNFVRLPFIIEGMVIGLVSAVVSTFLLMAVYDGILEIIYNILPFRAIPFSDVFLTVLIAFLLCGMVVGALGAFISIRKYLKKEGNEILGW